MLRGSGRRTEAKEGNAMNETDFEAKLKADGYTEIETQSLEPRPAKGSHGHPFAIRGLVLAGTFIVTQDNQRTVYGPGQVFAVAQDHPHDESIGPEGARILVGRKFAKG
jgi:quercetin dioxygenase-like cupin family protein